MKISLLAIVVSIAFSLSPSTFAASDVPVQGRLFIGAGQIDPEDANAELETQDLKTYNAIGLAGIEGLFPLFRYLNVGVRFTKEFMTRGSEDSGFSYNSSIKQDVLLGLIRIPIIKNDFMIFDIFGGYGGTNTTMHLYTSSVMGDYYKKDENGWFASPYSAYGASVAIGFKKIYLVLEGGYQNDKVTKLKTTGITAQKFSTLDLSGTYLTIGLLFDGMSGKK